MSHDDNSLSNNVDHSESEHITIISENGINDTQSVHQRQLCVCFTRSL